MDGREIDTSLKKTNLGSLISFKGVFTSDTLPFIPYHFKPIILISNTLDSKTDISVVGHWVAFYISFYPKKELYFFDSFGFSPSSYNDYFSQYINLYHDSHFRILEFGRQIQPDLSNKCGLYVIHFTHFTSLNGFTNFIKCFQNKFILKKSALRLNDTYVTKYFFNSVLKSKHCLPWKLRKKGKAHAFTYKECLFHIQR